MSDPVEKIKEQFPIFDSSAHRTPLHYLDNSATSQTPRAVLEAIEAHESRSRANVMRGVHDLSEKATEAYENAREAAAGYLGVDNPGEVVFTGGTTSALNMIALSLAEEFKPGDEIVLSLLEHHSNIVPWQILKARKGINLKFLPIDSDGCLEIDTLEKTITERTRLVSVTHGSNVTGEIPPVAEIAAAAHARGARLVLDGAQAAPHGPVDLPSLGADFYVFSGHKVYGPNGIGILWGRREHLEAMPPAFGGGEMVEEVSTEKTLYLPPPHKFEAGTPPIAQAVGLAAALKWYSSLDINYLKEHLDRLTQKLLSGITELGDAGYSIRIPGPKKSRRPVVSFHVAGIHPHDICQYMNDRHNVALRGGHHCAQPLHHALGLEATTRVSLAAYNNDRDVEVFLQGLEDCLKFLG